MYRNGEKEQEGSVWEIKLVNLRGFHVKNVLSSGDAAELGIEPKALVHAR